MTLRSGYLQGGWPANKIPKAASVKFVPTELDQKWVVHQMSRTGRDGKTGLGSQQRPSTGTHVDAVGDLVLIPSGGRPAATGGHSHPPSQPAGPIGGTSRGGFSQGYDRFGHPQEFSKQTFEQGKKQDRGRVCSTRNGQFHWRRRMADSAHGHLAS